VISECKNQINLLIKEIETRDKEIAEYKKQGVSISKSLRTKPFVENNFSTSCLESKAFRNLVEENEDTFSGNAETIFDKYVHYEKMKLSGLTNSLKKSSLSSNEQTSNPTPSLDLHLEGVSNGPLQLRYDSLSQESTSGVLAINKSSLPISATITQPQNSYFVTEDEKQRAKEIEEKLKKQQEKQKNEPKNKKQKTMFV